MENVAACLFPALNADWPGAATSQCVAVPVDVTALSADRQVQLLQVAWAIVLRSYTATDTPWFTYQDDRMPCHGRLYSCLDLSSQHLHVSSLATRIVTWKASDDLSSLSNTAVVLRRSPGHVGNLACCAQSVSLSIQAHGFGTDLTISLQYTTSLLSKAQAAGLGHVTAHVLAQIIQGATTLRSIHLCPDAAVDQLAQWNGEYPETADDCIHHLVLERCGHGPKHPAVCAWDGHFSYRDVAGLTETLSRHLASQGIGPECFVGIYSAKSKWTAIAMLSVLRAGGAFALLDTSFPHRRLAEMCNKLRVKLILCSRGLLQEAAAFRVPVTPVDDETLARLEPGADSEPAAGLVGPHNAAFAVFTSGSTGTPKAIIFNHSSFCSGQRQVIRTVGYGQSTRALQFASYAFDVSVFEHLTPLMSGGCVCIPSDKARNSNLGEAMRQMEVNLASLTPTVARLLRPEETVFLKKLLLLGEPVLESIVATWAGHVQLFNGYGPAECCVLATLHRFSSDNSLLGPNIIGHGAGAICWVVDPSDRQTLAPIGAVGELLVEGPIVGRGYVGDEEQTESSFISSPAWRLRFPHPHSPMYCTGDLVQYVGKGSLRYIGRRDSQAKLHGQRLELGDVEHCLHQVLPEGSRALAAVLKFADDSSPVLAGFIQCPGADKDTKGGLQGIFAYPSQGFRQMAERAAVDLAGRLPPYMIPSVMVPLVAIPTTATGKSDRRELARRASTLTKRDFLRSSVERQAPRTDNERLLYHAVEQMLQVSDFGMKDSFFSLGGDSINAMQLARRLREDTGLELALESVFTDPLLSDLASTMRPCQELPEIPPFSLIPDAHPVDEMLRTARDSCRLASTDSIEDIYPCTPLQEGIMALSVSSPEAQYVTVTTYRLPRAIDVERLQAGWDAVIASNPVLRTRIIQARSGQALQVVLKAGVEWEVAQDLDDLRAKHGRWRIELGAPLLRLVLLQSARGSHLCLMVSHALYDGWSLQETLSQVEAAYHGAAIESKPFKHFVQHILQSDEARGREFWERQLADFDAQPFPDAAAGLLHYRPAALETLRRSLPLPKCSPLGSTLSNAVSLAWSMTVSQYTGSKDVCFGATLAGRNVPVPGIDGILGPTMATIPLRVQLEPSLTVQQALSALQSQGRETMAFEHTGIQRIASFRAEAAAACRFQNHVVVQPPPADEASAIFAHADTREIVNSYPLSLEVTLPAATSNSLHLEAAYDVQVVPQWLMGCILSQFCHNVVETLSNLSSQLRDLPSLSSTDLGLMLDWNRRLPTAVECCVHDLVGRRSLGQPERPAIDAFDGRLTYGELGEYATRLASHLQSLGVLPGMYVMVMMERSLWAVVAMLAVAHAGAAFVMTDPSTPNLRLKQIRGDTEADLMITSAKYAPRAAELGLQAVMARGDESFMSSRPEFKPPPVSPDDAVYAVFTSGSTGSPKGVVVQHRALSTAATINGGVCDMDKTSRVLHVATFAADVSLAEVFYTLIQGGCVCIPSKTDSRNSLEDAMNRFRVDWATLTPSLARALTPAKLGTLRTMVLGGEAMTKVDVDMWADRVQLMNAYGPAECTIDATVQTKAALYRGASNIGFGAATVTWIVDPDDAACSRLVPLGAVGELVLEGPVLARGYLKDAAKTASSFVEYPDWLRRLRRGKPGRLYRTGDLAQYSPSGDGSLIYVGRRDNQVKLRGQRIELGEVERHLVESLPSAKEAIAEVVKPCDAGAEPALAAFVLFRDEKTGDGIIGPAEAAARAQFSSVESRLLSIVPRHMVPSLFLPLTRVPMTRTGKADRRLLRETASALTRKELRAYSTSAPQRRPPSTPQGAMLQRSVCDILRLPSDEVGMDDNFFQLGGDSITAMKVAGSVRDSGYVLTVADIFSHPRLGHLASRLEQVVQSSCELAPFSLLDETHRLSILQAAAKQCRVHADTIEDMYACTPMQEALVALAIKQPGQYVAEMTCELPEDADIGRVKAAWAAVYSASPILRTRIISPPSGSDSSLQVVVREPLNWSSTPCTLDVDDGMPLHKAAVLEKQGRRVLQIWIHHALYDGTSLPLLLEQAEDAFNGASLLPKPFNAFAAYTKSLDVESSRQFWRSEFADLNATMFPPIRSRRSSGQRESVSCDIALPDSPGLEFTLPSIIHSACAVTLGHYAYTEDVVYGLTLAGRNAPVPGIEELVGPTISTIPFRVQPSPNQTMRELLLEIQSHLVRVMAFEQTGLQAIRSMGPECAAACDFHCHLVIQPLGEETQQNRVFGGLETSKDAYSNFASSPLLLVVTIAADRRGVGLEANFDVSFLDATEAADFTRHLGHTIQQVLDNPDAEVQQLQVAGPHDLLRIQSRNATAQPRLDRLVHELVTERCRQRPNVEAVCSWDGSLTYGQLEDATSRLAQHLHGKDTGCSPVAALCMEKSQWTVVAILAILKSGFACALMDPSHPKPRLQEALRQTKPTLVLASPETRAVAEALVAGSNTAIVVVWPALLSSSPPRQAPSPRTASPSDAAFIVFTSGSSGKPKGIVLEHASVATGLRDLLEPHGLDDNSRVLHFASYAFDASFFEVLGCLTAGGCLCIPSETDRTCHLSEFIQRRRVNWAIMIPSTTHLLAPDCVTSLKTLVMAGEALKTADVQRWAVREDLRLLNTYGPAESVIAVATGQVLPTQWAPGLIGPVVNGLGWVVDPRDPGRLSALGAVGELLIEGPILSREYVGDAAKTAASFIPGPSWLSRIRGHGPGRLYRTGDLVQYTGNGHIRFVGRKDRQLKLNGQRIEPQEIESSLAAEFPKGTVVVVDLVVPESPTARPQIFAFVFLASTERTCADSLFAAPGPEFLALCHAAKQTVSQSLPRYMVPSIFVPLNHVPRTGTGKINHRLLSQAARSLQASRLDSPSQRPLSEPERGLALLWAELLSPQAHGIGAGDNFFHLGGDSVTAMRLVATARARGLELTVPAIFAHPQLADMASAAQPVTGSSAALPPFSLIPEGQREALLEAAEQQCSVRRGQIEDIYPCTPLQEALVSQSMRSPGAYWARFRYTLSPETDGPRLELAWSRVIGDNPILRTRLIQASAIYQVVLAEDALCEVVDVDSLEGFESPLKSGDMQLGRPLLQLVLSRPADCSIRPETCLTIHHSLYDGWSLQLILDQVRQAYAGKTEQCVVQPFHRFVDHVAQQDQEASRNFWLAQLSDGVAFPPLPASDYRPYTDATLRQRVKLAAVPDVTLATVLEFSWAATVSQYCDSAAVTYGLVLSGRNASLEGIEAVAGPTITTVPVRFVLDKDEPIASGLRRCQGQRASATPFEQFGLQNIRRLSSQAGTFQNLLLIQQATTPSADGLLVPVDDEVEAGSFSAYAVEVSCDISGDECLVTVDYDSNVLDGRQARRILASFAHTLAQIQSHPEHRLSDLRLLAPSAWAELSEWNRLLPDPINRCIHEGIREQCLRAPNADAVCAWDGSFTYREVDRLSSRLASHLQSIGVGPDMFVPVLSEKSKWVAVALLGLVKAGGAIVLLDPALPLPRMQTICSSVDARVVLASDAQAALAPRLASTVITIGNGAHAWKSNAPTFAPNVGPQNALYAIFTSGSTGKPKGIVISHSAANSSGSAQQAPLYLDGNTRTLQFASHMFDVSIADYLWTLLAGGCVCVASEESLRDDLAGAISRFRVNRADLTPSIARVLCPDEVPTLKTLLLGGEPLSQHDVRTWAGKVQLVNGYGPSECSICCTLADVRVDSDPSTIGRTYGAVPWVVDRDDHNVLVPIGAVGELVLEGHTLAREYLGEPEKTAAAFLQRSPPWLRGLRPNSRLYKTGDLVRYNPDGTLRYLGRKDTQVKIRGQRVELGEIEHQIRELSPSVRDVVVEVIGPTHKRLKQLLAVFASNFSHEGEPDRKNGVLFLPPTRTYRDQALGILSALRSRLPTYMVPDVMIPLSHMPLSANGKADRRLLRDEAAGLTWKQIEQYQPGLSIKRPPNSEPETALHQIVADVLGLDLGEVGMDDSFFRLGGDSITAIRLVQRAQARGFTFRVSSVFQSPRLSDLSQMFLQPDDGVESGNSDGTRDSFELLDLVDKEDMAENLSSRGFSCSGSDICEILPVTQAAERFLFQTPEYWILNLRGPVDSDRLQRACTALVLRHGILRTVFVHEESRHLQIVLDQIDTTIEHHTTSKTVADFVDGYRNERALATPTLDAPVTHFALVQSKGGVQPEQALVVRLSHAQFDGYCLHTLWRDLKQLYEGACLPAAAPYSSHMQQWTQSQTDDAFAFWRDTLAGSSPARINNGTFGDINQDSTADSVFVTSRQLAQVAGASLPDITAATMVKVAWAALLATLSGTHDCVFAQVSNGRNYNSAAAHDMVGMCLNFIPVCVKLDPALTALEFLESLQRQHYESLAFELVDFRDIVRRSTSWSRGTTHQSIVVHQNIDPDELFAFGDAEAWVTCSYEWPHPPDEILIESRPARDGNLHMTMDTRSHVLSQRNADAVMNKLCRLIAALSEHPEASIGTLLAAID